MNVGGRPMRTIWLGADGRTVEIIDQTRLPHELVIVGLKTLADAARAIGTMQVRGAPLIGAAAAYGVALGLAEDPSDAALDAAVSRLAATRPTAVNLRWALAEMRRSFPMYRKVADLPWLWRVPARSPRRRRDQPRDRRERRPLIAEAWQRKG